jgi:enoyl-CoA hydratase/carnithine racemase
VGNLGVRQGVPLIGGGTVRLPRLVGEGRARDIILTGRKVNAQECYRIASASGWRPTAKRAAPPRTWHRSWRACRKSARAPTAGP